MRKGGFALNGSLFLIWEVKLWTMSGKPRRSVRLVLKVPR